MIYQNWPSQSDHFCLMFQIYCLIRALRDLKYIHHFQIKQDVLSKIMFHHNKLGQGFHASTWL